MSTIYLFLIGQLANQERIILSRVEDSPFYRDAFYLERLAQIVKANISGKEIVIINIHLEAFDKAIRAKQFKEVEAFLIDIKTIILLFFWVILTLVLEIKMQLYNSY